MTYNNYLEATSISSKERLNDIAALAMTDSGFQENAWQVKTSLTINNDTICAKTKKGLSNALSNSIDSATSGFKRTIDTLTGIRAGFIEQTFYELGGRTLNDFIPQDLRLNGNTWEDQILIYKAFQVAPSFEAGTVKDGDGQIQRVDAGVSSVYLPVKTWAAQLDYTMIQINQASQSGNWDLIALLEKTRKKYWDLGLQQMAFLGLKSDSNFRGLLNQSSVTPDTTTITKYLKDMTTDEFNTFLGNMKVSFNQSVNFTVDPNRFLISKLDHDGLGQMMSAQFPLKSRLQVLRDTFAEIGGEGAEVIAVAYCDSSKNNIGNNRYVMYRYDADTLSMTIPVPYTVLTQAMSLNGFSFQNVAFGRYTPVIITKPQEVVYFDFA